MVNRKTNLRVLIARLDRRLLNCQGRVSARLCKRRDRYRAQLQEEESAEALILENQRLLSEVAVLREDNRLLREKLGVDVVPVRPAAPAAKPLTREEWAKALGTDTALVVNPGIDMPRVHRRSNDRNGKPVPPIVEVPPGPSVVLTRELIDACRTRGSFTRSSLIEFGKVLGKPPMSCHGWVSAIVGRRMPIDSFEAALNGVGMYGRNGVGKRRVIQTVRSD
jgi:hypothetical protein